MTLCRAIWQLPIQDGERQIRRSSELRSWSRWAQGAGAGWDSIGRKTKTCAPKTDSGVGRIGHDAANEQFLPLLAGELVLNVGALR